MGNQNWKHRTPNLLKEGLKITKSSSSISATCLKWVLKSDCMSTGKVKSCRTRLGCWGFWRLYGTIFIFFVQIKWLYCRYTDEEYYKTWISTRRTRISDLSWWKGLCVLRDMHHDFKQIKALSKTTFCLMSVCIAFASASTNTELNENQELTSSLSMSKQMPSTSKQQIQ